MCGFAHQKQWKEKFIFNRKIWISILLLLSLSKTLYLFDCRVDYEKAGRSLRQKVFNLPRKPLSQVILSGIYIFEDLGGGVIWHYLGNFSLLFDIIQKLTFFSPKDICFSQIQQTINSELILFERGRAIIFQENFIFVPGAHSPSFGG